MKQKILTHWNKLFNMDRNIFTNANHYISRTHLLKEGWEAFSFVKDDYYPSSYRVQETPGIANGTPVQAIPVLAIWRLLRQQDRYDVCADGHRNYWVKQLTAKIMMLLPRRWRGRISPSWRDVMYRPSPVKNFYDQHLSHSDIPGFPPGLADLGRKPLVW